MIFELSRDYDRAWELIQKGERLACEYDRLIHRDVGQRSKSVCGSTITISSQMLIYCYLPTVFRFFVERCTELNVEFYLPCEAPNAIPIVVTGGTVKIDNFSF